MKSRALACTLLSTLSLGVACGGDGDGAPFESHISVAPEKKLSELSADERSQLCAEFMASAFTAMQADQKRLCSIAVDNADDTGAAACSNALDDCLAEDPDTLEVGRKYSAKDVGDVACELPATCGASVEDYKACLDWGTQRSIDFYDQFSCGDELGTPAKSTWPDACKRIDEACPGTLDD